MLSVRCKSPSAQVGLTLPGVELVDSVGDRRGERGDLGLPTHIAFCEEQTLSAVVALTDKQQINASFDDASRLSRDRSAAASGSRRWW